jgi:hypothetical protein
MTSARSQSIIVIDDDIVEVDDLEILDHGRIIFHIFSVRILYHTLFSWSEQLHEELEFDVSEKDQNLPELFRLFMFCC